MFRHTPLAANSLKAKINGRGVFGQRIKNNTPKPNSERRLNFIRIDVKGKNRRGMKRAKGSSNLTPEIKNGKQ